MFFRVRFSFRNIKFVNTEDHKHLKYFLKMCKTITVSLKSCSKQLTFLKSQTKLLLFLWYSPVYQIID